ncbi:MAG TPA: hypothetical protein VG496_14840, partial [Myxococcales bacterium]|nr:hypothetical protein [Myxococcales bacterium]
PDEQRAAAVPVAVLREEAGRAAPPKRTVLEGALAMALTTAKDVDGALRASAAVANDMSGSAAAYRLQSWILLRFKRYAEVIEQAEQRLAAKPGDPDALDQLAFGYSERGDLEAGREWWILRAQRDDPSSALNNAAWNSLCRNKASEADLPLIRRAMELDRTPNPSHQHTLAALEAVTGHSAEARQLLRRRIENRSVADISDSDWLLVGLLAESDGLPKTARAAYARITSKDDSSPTAVAAVARTREKLLPSVQDQSAPRCRANRPETCPIGFYCQPDEKFCDGLIASCEGACVKLQ